MYKLGITGGVSSGKTTAAEYFRLKEGSFVFNADKESKRHLKNSKGLQKKIINSFGQGVVENNKLVLELLAKKAFSNEINHKILNGIMWPEIFILISKKCLNNSFKTFLSVYLPFFLFRKLFFNIILLKN